MADPRQERGQTWLLVKLSVGKSEDIITEPYSFDTQCDKTGWIFDYIVFIIGAVAHECTSVCNYKQRKTA